MTIGRGSARETLNENQVTDICAQGLSSEKLDNKKVLVIIPDHTRTAPIDMMFRVIYSLLSGKVKLLDFLVALGTHPPMSEESILNRVGISKEEYQGKYPKARFFNHHWNDAKQLKHIGIIKEDEVSELTYGLLKQRVDVSINRLVFNYDLLLIVGPTFPHEVVGFSGGNKYLFPGIAGGDIINMFHWFGALVTNPVINGEKFTPVRAIIDKAASFVHIKCLCMSLVVRGENLSGLYVGTPQEAWEKSADISEKIHIIYKDRLFRKILSCAPKMYDDLWTAGKCMYKLEPVVEDGGELIIYAPHIKEISVTHGHIIEKIGYHVRDYFFKQMNKFKDIPAAIMAHSTHVRGIGTYEKGIENPRIKVTLATQIPAKLCKKINLGYLDPEKINIEEWKNREKEGILYVPKAGEELYRLKSTVLDVIE
jgi:nickel-dependent lactate racemase